METNVKKRGRPSVSITWPDELLFTAQDVVAKMDKPVSRVTVHNKIKQAVVEGVLREVGSQKTPNGRPRITYTKTASLDMETPTSEEK